MKKISLLLCCYLCLSSSLFAQNYQVGTITQTFTDNSRSRDIATDLYYPTENGNIANGQFPVLVFGHGFTIGTGSYSHLWETLVPLGYILALPTTEGNFAPNHGTFGLDLAFVADAIQVLGNDANSSFFNKIAPTTAVMGHSMGGGAAFLAAEANPNITTIVTLAAAETNPSAIGAAANITMPALTIAGTKDCVTPNENHQIPMHEALAASCKLFYNITNGTHCHFSDGSANSCYLGEGFTCIGQEPFLDRTLQDEVMFSALIPWLDYWLKDDCDSWNGLTNYLTTPNASFDIQTNCTETCAANNGLLVQAKAHLEGAFNGIAMNTGLLNANVLPTNQPYNRSPWNYAGAEMATNTPTNAVDWVLLEARSASDINLIMETKAALLLSNGDIVDANGSTNGVLFNDLTENESYYFVVRHRNHLDVISSNTVAVPNATAYDFGLPANVMLGSSQLKDVGNGVFALFAGDNDGNGVFTVNDYNIYIAESAALNSYNDSDCNLNAAVEVSDFNLYVPNASVSGVTQIRY